MNAKAKPAIDKHVFELVEMFINDNRHESQIAKLTQEQRDMLPYMIGQLVHDDIEGGIKDPQMMLEGCETLSMEKA